MLTRLSLRKSLPLVLGLFGLAFTLLLTAWHLPWRADEALHSWRNHTQQHLALLQSSLSDHRRYGRIARWRPSWPTWRAWKGCAGQWSSTSSYA